MFKNHIFLQNGSSTLLDISLQNVMAHPAENLQVFDVSQTRWSSELAPQSSYNFAFLGVLLQNALGAGASCNYKMPVYKLFIINRVSTCQNVRELPTGISILYVCMHILKKNTRTCCLI